MDLRSIPEYTLGMPMCPHCEKLVKDRWDQESLVLHRTCLLAFIHEREANVIDSYLHVVQGYLDEKKDKTS